MHFSFCVLDNINNKLSFEQARHILFIWFTQELDYKNNLYSTYGT